MAKTNKRGNKRSLFRELMSAVRAMRDHLAGELTVRTHNSVRRCRRLGQSPPLARNPFAEIACEGVVVSRVRTTSDCSGVFVSSHARVSRVQSGPED